MSKINLEVERELERTKYNKYQTETQNLKVVENKLEEKNIRLEKPLNPKLLVFSLLPLRVVKYKDESIDSEVKDIIISEFNKIIEEDRFFIESRL